MTDSIDYRFQCGDFPDDKFHVARFTGEEGISRLYRFQVDLVSDDAEIDVDDLQDQPSTFTIAGGAHERRIQGVAAEVEVLDQVGDRTIYRLTIVPRVWQLGLTRVNAVYLDRTTPEVVEGTLEEQLGITSVDYETSLRADYRSWPFRLQYGESYWDYLSRLMERDGIYYYFVAGEDGERIVFCDSAREQPAIEDPELPHTASLGMSASDDALAHGTIDSLILRQCRQPKTVWVQNYNDDKPSTPIREQAEVDPRGTGDINLYGQNVLDSEEAAAIAAIRAEELRCTKAVYHGESTAFRLAPGHRFELTRHRRPQNNQEYQLVSIEHSGHNPAVTSLIGQVPPAGTPVYENRFTAIPADTQYRPPRTTDWPSIRGTLNAEIDAEGDGRFAELDEEGRYHVVFPFHRGFDDPGREDAGKASHWVRLVQPYSGEREGMHFPLRKGTRVLIGFIGGNPDLPVITGAIPSAEQTSVTSARNQPKGNIQTQNNRIEIDDEYPRIKLESRKSGSYFHLGSSNAPGDGMTSVTDGLNRLLSLGGNHYTIATYGWPEGVKSGHSVTDGVSHGDLQALNDSLEQAHDAQTGVTDWTQLGTEKGFEWTKDKIFKFPDKHGDGNTDSDDNLKEDGTNDDGRHDLLINRTVGVAYTYRLGIDFSFQDPAGNEAFDFGPKATYVASRHDEDPAGLRAKKTAAIPRFPGNKDKEKSEQESDWKAKLENGRISINKYDSFVWHEGDIYDFGGCWNYNLGNGYEESHVVQTAVLNESGLDKDLLAKGGPDWMLDDNGDPLDDPWSAFLDGTIKDELDENKDDVSGHQMLVSKTFGDTYDYHDGVAMDVQIGASCSIKKGGPNVEKTYKGYNDQLVEHVKAEPAYKETWRNHPDSGTPLFYGRESWGVKEHGAGKNSFSTEFAPSLSLDIKAAFSLSMEVNTGVVLNSALNVGSFTDVDITIGNKNSLEVVLAFLSDISFTAAGKLEVENTTITLSAPGFTSKTKSNSSDMSISELTSKVNELSQTTTALEARSVTVANATIEIMSGMSMKA